MSFDGGSFQIEGFPDAEKIIAIQGARGKRLSDLDLHRADLIFAQDCLQAINVAPNEPRVIREALWSSAIIHFFKCAGDSGARSQLSLEKILKNEPLEAMLVFNHFKALRNKHFVHDENSYAQSIPAAILNKAHKSAKIEKIICISTFAETLDQGNYANLGMLIQKTLSWVTAEFDTLSELLRAELEAESYAALLAMASPTYRVPTADEVSKKRESLGVKPT